MRDRRTRPEWDGRSARPGVVVQGFKGVPDEYRDRTGNADALAELANTMMQIDSGIDPKVNEQRSGGMVIETVSLYELPRNQYARFKSSHRDNVSILIC